MGLSAIEDLWRNTLWQIPSLIGRLVYLSGLRDPNTGRYSHHGLAMRFGGDEADAAIRKSHEDAFRRCLSMTMAEKREDAELYWSSLLEDERLVADVWRRTESYRTLAPISASSAQRMDFQEHMKLLLEWIRRGHDGGGRGQDASPRP
jgi:hypothetical protein